MAKKNFTASLELSGEERYSCNTSKTYSDSFTIEQELDDSDAFITLSTFSKSVASLTIANAKACVIKNVSNIAAEVSITTRAWTNVSSVDAQNSEDIGGGGATVLRTWTQILPAGDFMYLNTNRLVAYEPSAGGTLESGAYAPVGMIRIEPKDINSGAETRAVAEINSATYGTGTAELIAEDVAIAETDITVDDASWFKVGDLFGIGSEVLEVLSISGEVLTVRRGLLGSVDAAHSDNAPLLYFFGNEYLPFDTGKCQTDASGRFKQRGAFFGYARTTAEVADGLVAGSVAIGPFYTEGGYLDWGLSGITANQKTGLAASTTYTFHIVVDEYNAGGIDSVSSETAIAFTTDASDTTWNGSSNAVLPKIQAVFDEQFYTTSSGLKDKKVTIGIVNGDVRVTSHSNHSETRVGIANVSGTTPFGVGNFPPLASSVPDLLGTEHGGGTTDNIVYGPTSALAPETIDDRETSKSETNTAVFIFDDGKGNLMYQGSAVGWIDYEKGHCEWHVPSLPNAEFKIYGQSHSAHSGGISGTANGENTIKTIQARSVNRKQSSKVKMVLYG